MYKALFKVFEAAQGPAILASADGAGPLDYSDFPVKYPLITTAMNFGSRQPAGDTSDSPAHTAKIIAWFAASVLDGEERQLLKNTVLPAGVEFIQKNTARRSF